MNRAAIYVRVSTEDQAREGFSLEAQKERLISYCEAQGWDVAAVYADEGQSGRSSNRPEYKKMLEEKEDWDTILVMKMDRIHRNSKNFMIMMENLEKWGKKFTSMQESLDTSNAVGRFVVDIIQRIAQLESEQIGERTKMGMAQKHESGNGLLGFNPPFGYRIKDNDLEIVEEEAPVVQEIFNRYLRGETMDQIAWTLNRDGITTRMQKPWSVWSISHILHNPAYAGFRRWDEILVPSSHRSIIGREDFNAVQRRMAENVRNPHHKHIVELPDVPSSKP